MKTIVPITVIICATIACNGPEVNSYYPTNREPLTQAAYVKLPLGAIRPHGWLNNQLTIQANGLTGHLDEFWPSVQNSAWKGGDGEAWERGPYYLDGLIPLAYLLDDQRLIQKSQVWIEWILSSGQDNGWFGPDTNADRWPLAVTMKALTQYQEATGDKRVIPLLTNYFSYLNNESPDWPDSEWRGVRAKENLLSAFWLYNRTGNRDILKVAESITASSYDWSSYFREFPWDTDALNEGRIPHIWDAPGLTAHVVNIAMAVKYPGLRYLLTGDESYKSRVFEALRNLDEHHGQVTGRFSGDEHLSGKRPTQGTEYCAVVEFMFSLEELMEILGDARLADRLEMLAFNAIPGTTMPDFWAHQYDQQSNQVLCTVAKRDWASNRDDANLYGLEPDYGCCTANMHQGWPKFVSHMWMATHDQGLVAVAYGPSEVKARVADGVDVTILEETQYPFQGHIRFTVTVPEPLVFPLHLRIPAWAEGAVIQVGKKTISPEAGTFAVIKRKWSTGDSVVLNLPMKVRVETRYHDAVSVMRGPLYFALRIGERFKELKHYYLQSSDWEVHPTTPWNYGLIIDKTNPENSFVVETRDIAGNIWDQENAPVVLRARGKAIPEWTIVNNSAGDTPQSPVISDQPLTELELIPYGNTRLRITEFPVIDDR